jgi:hypothetical protein
MLELISKELECEVMNGFHPSPDTILWRSSTNTPIHTRNLFNGWTTVSSRLWGLVVRVPGYRSRDPGSIFATTRFSEK